MAGSTNFIQWNPNVNNQETDAQYAADSFRANGIPSSPAIAPGNAHNKLFYQLTTFVAAFGQMMSNKGYNVSDANLAALITAVTNVITAADLEDQLTPSTSQSGLAFGQGYFRLPAILGGFTIQWGDCNIAPNAGIGNADVQMLPLPFANHFFGVVICPYGNYVSTTNMGTLGANLIFEPDGVTIYLDRFNVGSSFSSEEGGHWIALGN